MDIRLKVIEGKPQGATIPLKGPQYLIGRDPTCQLRPKHESVSARHCKLRVVEDHVSVRDLGTESGTILNGQKLSPADSAIAFHGDRLQVGNLVFEVAVDPVPRPQTDLDEEPDELSAAAQLADRIFQLTVSDSVDPGRPVGMHTRIEKIDGIPVVQIMIPHICEEGVGAFRRELRALASRPALNRVVLDFHKVQGISRDAAELILAFYHRVAEHRGQVKLCDVCPDVLRVFEATGVTEQMTIAIDVHDAIWSSW